MSVHLQKASFVLLSSNGTSVQYTITLFLMKVDFFVPYYVALYCLSKDFAIQNEFVSIYLVFEHCDTVHSLKVLLK